MARLGMSIPVLPGPKSRRPKKRPGDENIDLVREIPTRHNTIISPNRPQTEPNNGSKTPRPSPKTPRTNDR